MWRLYIMKKVAIYCRVSTQDQVLENQIIKLEEYAKNRDYLYEVFKEKETTRKTRPVKYDLLRRLRSREYDGLLVWKLDRWARSSIELLSEITELYEKGVNFISYQDHIDLSTSGGRLQFQILSAFAEFERSIISERTLLGLERAKKQGKRLGRPKGSTDKKHRKKSGYYLRWSKGSK